MHVRRPEPQPPRAACDDVVVGTDLVAIDDVAQAVASFGDRYLRRVYTDGELGDCLGGASPRHGFARLAARFAAKESTMKALRLGDAALSFRAIEVVRADDGAPAIALHGDARGLAERLGIAWLNVSLTHEDRWAAAVVVAGRARRPGPPRLASRIRGRAPGR